MRQDWRVVCQLNRVGKLAAENRRTQKRDARNHGQEVHARTIARARFAAIRSARFRRRGAFGVRRRITRTPGGRRGFDIMAGHHGLTRGISRQYRACALVHHLCRCSHGEA